MRAPIAAMAALAGGLLFLPAVQGPASATSAPINLKKAAVGVVAADLVPVGAEGAAEGAAPTLAAAVVVAVPASPEAAVAASAAEALPEAAEEEVRA
jgi:hypothetical protein